MWTEDLTQQRGVWCFVKVELETYNLTVGVCVDCRRFGSLQNPEVNSAKKVGHFEHS